MKASTLPFPPFDLTRPTALPRARIFRTAAVVAVWVYLAVLIYMSLIPIVPSETNISDKTLHFLAYGGLTGLAAAAWPKMGLVKLFIFLSGVGALLEIGQGVLAMGRMASWGDQIANMSGIALALVIWICLACLKSKLLK